MIKRAVLLGAVLSLSLVSNVYAAGWEQFADGIVWRYDHQGYAVGWQWIDDNGDDIAECYYCTPCLKPNTQTPDGYETNEKGAWIVNGYVQTKNLADLRNNADLQALRSKPFAEMTEEEIELYIKEIMQYTSDDTRYIKDCMEFHGNMGGFEENWRNKSPQAMTHLELDVVLYEHTGCESVHGAYVDIDAARKLNLGGSF